MFKPRIDYDNEYYLVKYWYPFCASVNKSVMTWEKPWVYFYSALAWCLIDTGGTIEIIHNYVIHRKKKGEPWCNGNVAAMWSHV